MTIRSIATFSPSVLQLEDDSDGLDQPAPRISGIALAAGEAFQVPEDMGPADLSLIDGVIVIAPMPIADQDSGKVSQ